MLTILGKNVDPNEKLSCTQVGQLLVSYFLNYLTSFWPYTIYLHVTPKHLDIF